MCVTANQKWTTREKKPQFSSIYQTRRQGEAEVLLTDFNSFFVHYEVIKECPFNTEKERPYCERPLVLNSKENINSK